MVSLCCVRLFMKGHIMKNRLAAAAAPALVHYSKLHHAPQTIGMVERFATAGDFKGVRTMTAINRNPYVHDLYQIATVVQYEFGGNWYSYSQEYSTGLSRALKLAYSESRKAFKTAVSRKFAAELHSDVYVPDTDDIDC